MSYALVYAYDGHEFWEADLDTIDAVNEMIRHLYDKHGSVAILRIEQTHDGPRTWQIEYPPAPPAGTRVHDKSGEVHTLGERGEIGTTTGTVYTWKGVLESFGPLTEVVETEVEAAARRLRGKDFGQIPYGCPPDIFNDMRIVLAHVMSGGKI